MMVVTMMTMKILMMTMMTLKMMTMKMMISLVSWMGRWISRR